ncbi:auxin efflux carrier family protein, partial [Tremellales sp. Uapishka_1]
MATAGQIIYKGPVHGCWFYHREEGHVSSPGRAGMQYRQHGESSCIGILRVLGLTFERGQNIGLPCLIFTSMVTAFNSQNISAFPPLLMMAICYIILGGLAGWLTSEFFTVPNDFKYGIIVMGLISNWGNLPTAIVQTMGKSAPFNPDTDVELGVAYIAVFVLVMNVIFFPLGAHKLCALDFREGQQLQAPALPFKQRWARRFEKVVSIRYGKRKSSLSDDDNEPPGFTSITSTGTDGEMSHTDDDQVHSMSKFVGGVVPTRKISRAASFTTMMETTKRIPATTPLDAPDLTDAIQCVPSSSTSAGGPLLPVCSHNNRTYSYHEPSTPVPSIHKPPLKKRILSFAKQFLTPPTLSVILGLPISTIPPLKALFTTSEGWTGTRMPNGPDGKPPLAFILDTTTFLGGVSVPVALVLLGASFARLSLPKRWKDLPISAIVSMTVAKMIIIPVFGIFVVQALAHKTSLFPASDKMRTFVAILLSGTPASANQLVITQLYNPAGEANTLASFLLLQYALMFVLSTALAAIALYIVET